MKKHIDSSLVMSYNLIMPYRKRPFKLLFRVLELFLSGNNQTETLVQKSYDHICTGYDKTWTNHMRDITSILIDKMDIKPRQKAIDLTCGTGYATGLIAERTGTKIIGVDASGGMLTQAQQNCTKCCEFIQADVLDYLGTVPSESVDVVTCCWGLGYSKPLRVLRQIRRILKKGGKVGIVDNTLFSLREVMYCSILAFMEQPDKLEHLMKFRFLTGKRHLWTWYRLSGLKPVEVWGGSKSYPVENGIHAIEKLRSTGAAAGFEYASNEADSEDIFNRFAQILEAKYAVNGQIQIMHRYLGGIAVK